AEAARGERRAVLLSMERVAKPLIVGRAAARESARHLRPSPDGRLVVVVRPDQDVVGDARAEVDQLGGILQVIEDAARQTEVESVLAAAQVGEEVTADELRRGQSEQLLDD